MGNDRPDQNGVYEFKPRTTGTQRIAQIERYWDTVRGNRLVPSRCEIDPRGLEGVLSSTFILERIAGGLARFRIAGSHLAELTGLELRQMPLSALFTVGSRDVLSEALTSVFDDPSMIHMSIASPEGYGREKLQGEMILLPLRSDLGDIDRVLGGLVLEGRPGRAPRRIEILSQCRKTLTGYAGPAHVQRPVSRPVSRPVTTNLGPADQVGQSRGHLRLVVSNDKSV